jgi:hypothetical protein
MKVLSAVLLAMLAIPGVAMAAKQRDVLVVSNNWAGTADLIDTHTFKRIKRINVIPDRAERVAQIEADPAWKSVYDFNRAVPGEGHN